MDCCECPLSAKFEELLEGQEGSLAEALREVLARWELTFADGPPPPRRARVICQVCGGETLHLTSFDGRMMCASCVNRARYAARRGGTATNKRYWKPGEPVRPGSRALKRARP